MESLTFSASHQGNSSELQNAKPAKPVVRSVQTGGDTAVPDLPATDQVRPTNTGARTETQASSFEARLNYDKDKALLFVEILDPATGDVVQRIPAETAADRIRELTGSYGGTVVDKIA